jgi:flagellar biosynthesis protein FlhG
MAVSGERAPSPRIDPRDGQRLDGPRIVAVAGGKGGTGKSLLAANIGIFLATLGKRVIVVDAALGTPDLHVFCAVYQPIRTLSEYLGRERQSLADVCVPTPVPGLRLISGASDPTWVSSPRPGLVRRFAAELRRLPADYVIVDLGAGTSDWVLDLFLSADTGIVITLPEPTAVEQAYRFMRCALLARLRRAGLGGMLRIPAADMRRSEGGIIAPLDLYLRALRDADPRAVDLERAILGFQPHLVVNWARSKADMEMGRAISSAARRRLGIPVTYLGHLEYDEAVWVAVRRRRPLLVEHPESRVSKCIEKVTRGVLAERGEPAATAVIAGDSHYDLLEVAPTASFEDIRRANRRVRDIYGPESVVMSGLYEPAGLEAVHRRFDLAYTTLMDASKRKEYDLALFPDGVPLPLPVAEPTPTAAPAIPVVAPPSPVPSERPPMPLLTPRTEYTGALLQQIREAHGIDLREISERTKIGMAYLHAIESEDLRRLPAIVYVRGFLSEYAKILGLETARVLDSYLERYRAARAGTHDGERKSDRDE